MESSTESSTAAAAAAAAAPALGPQQEQRHHRRSRSNSSSRSSSSLWQLDCWGQEQFQRLRRPPPQPPSSPLASCCLCRRRHRSSSGRGARCMPQMTATLAAPLPLPACTLQQLPAGLCHRPHWVAAGKRLGRAPLAAAAGLVPPQQCCCSRQGPHQMPSRRLCSRRTHWWCAHPAAAAAARARARGLCCGMPTARMPCCALAQSQKTAPLPPLSWQSAAQAALRVQLQQTQRGRQGARRAPLCWCRQASTDPAPALRGWRMARWCRRVGGLQHDGETATRAGLCVLLADHHHSSQLPLTHRWVYTSRAPHCTSRLHCCLATAAACLPACLHYHPLCLQRST